MSKSCRHECAERGTAPRPLTVADQIPAQPNFFPSIRSHQFRHAQEAFARAHCLPINDFGERAWPMRTAAELMQRRLGRLACVELVALEWR